MGECEGQGRVSGFVQALLMCADVLGLGLQVLASKHAHVCLSGKFLGPRHASACFSQHMARLFVHA